MNMDIRFSHWFLARFICFQLEFLPWLGVSALFLQEKESARGFPIFQCILKDGQIIWANRLQEKLRLVSLWHNYQFIGTTQSFTLNPLWNLNPPRTRLNPPKGQVTPPPGISIKTRYLFHTWNTVWYLCVNSVFRFLYSESLAAQRLQFSYHCSMFCSFEKARVWSPSIEGKVFELAGANSLAIVVSFGS